jgi:hypothetical protein
MRSVLLILAIVAVVGLAASTASAGGHGGHRGSGIYIYNNAPPPVYYHSPARYYGGYSRMHYYGGETHSQAVKRITATHSRYRYRTHPRSLYNGPPHPYDYFGW